MRPSLLVLGLLVATAPATSALTLLDHDEGTPTRIVVRVDEGPLRGNADPNVSLANASVDADWSRLDVARQDWRGFANATQLEASGEGWLVLADGASGVAVALEAPEGTQGSNGSPPEEAQTSSRDPEAGSDASSEPGSATTPAEGHPNASRSSASSPGTDDGEPGPRAADRSQHPGPEGGPAWTSPLAIALAVLAVGAFLVERWTRREEDPE